MLNPYAVLSSSQYQRILSTIASPANLDRRNRTASCSLSKRPHSPFTVSRDLSTTVKRLKSKKNITDIDISQVDNSAIEEAVDEASACSTLLHFESTTVAAAAVLGGEDGYDCTEDKSVGAVIKRLLLKNVSILRKRIWEMSTSWPWVRRMGCIRKSVRVTQLEPDL